MIWNRLDERDVCVSCLSWVYYPCSFFVICSKSRQGHRHDESSTADHHLRHSLIFNNMITNWTTFLLWAWQLNFYPSFDSSIDLWLKSIQENVIEWYFFTYNDDRRTSLDTSIDWTVFQSFWLHFKSSSTNSLFSATRDSWQWQLRV